MTFDPNPERREEFAARSNVTQNRWALQTDKLAIELGQSGLKTATLLNGGALVAIPAVITLFGIDPKYIMRGLLFAGGCFILGLVFSWLSTFFGFFTLAHRYDRDFANAETTKNNVIAHLPATARWREAFRRG